MPRVRIKAIGIHYITAHPDASPYHLYAWKKAVENAYNHKGYYLIAKEGQNVVGVLPLIHIKFPFVINEITALPFCDVGNLLSDNETVVKLLLQKAWEIKVEHNVSKIDIRGNLADSVALQYNLTKEDSGKVRMFLPLPGSSENLLSGFKSKLRSQIKKAEKNGLNFQWGTLQDIKRFYSVMSSNMRDLGSPVHSCKWFQSVLKYYGDQAKMGMVSYEKQTIGCCIILFAGNKMSIPWASTLREFNKFAPNMLLYWNVLKFAADNHFTQFDFGRSTEGEGTFKFKQQWGATPTPLIWYSNTTPQNYKTSEKKTTYYRPPPPN